jgi:hypothetical protein
MGFLINLAVLADVQVSMARDLIAGWPTSIKTAPCSFVSVRIPALFRPRIAYVARFDPSAQENLGQFVRVMLNMACDFGFFAVVWVILILAFRSSLPLASRISDSLPSFFPIFARRQSPRAHPHPSMPIALSCSPTGARFGELLGTCPILYNPCVLWALTFLSHKV